MTVQRALLACSKADEDTRRRVAAALRANGLDVTIASDSRAAEQAIDTQRFDLLVADVRTRTADGRALLVAVAERHPGLPTCALTDAPRFEAARDALRAGAVDLLTPPIDPRSVAEAVQRARRRVHAPRGAGVGASRLEAADPKRAPGARPRVAIANLAESEQAMILRTLEETRGNRTESARRLGISVRTLWNRLKRYEEKGVVLPSRRRPRATAHAPGDRS